MLRCHGVAYRRGSAPPRRQGRSTWLLGGAYREHGRPFCCVSGLRRRSEPAAALEEPEQVETTPQFGQLSGRGHARRRLVVAVLDQCHCRTVGAAYVVAGRIEVGSQSHPVRRDLVTPQSSLARSSRSACDEAVITQRLERRSQRPLPRLRPGRRRSPRYRSRTRWSGRRSENALVGRRCAHASSPPGCPGRGA
jgi:hypothetical protein